MKLKVTLSTTIDVSDEDVDGLSEVDIVEYVFNSSSYSVEKVENVCDE